MVIERKLCIHIAIKHVPVWTKVNKQITVVVQIRAEGTYSTDAEGTACTDVS